MVDPVPLALTFAKLAISKGEKESFFNCRVGWGNSDQKKKIFVDLL